MKMIKISAWTGILLCFLFGCIGKEQYPSTATVKIEILSIGKSSAKEQVPSSVYSYLPSIIKGAGVLGRAANGAIVEIIWTEPSSASVIPISTKVFAQSKLGDILYGGKETKYVKAIRPISEPIEPLKNVIRRNAGGDTPYSENETIRILSRNIEVEADQTTGEIRITAYSDDAADAKTIADTVALAYISFIEEDNAAKIEKMVSNILDENVLKQKESINEGPNISKLEAQLIEIKKKYNLDIGDDGIPKKPDTISEKEKEKIILRPEIMRLKTVIEQFGTGNIEDKARYFSKDGNTAITEQIAKVGNMKIEVSKLSIETGEKKDDKEKAKAELQNAETKLKAEEAKLQELVASAMDELIKDLAEKETSLAALNSEIEETEKSFFAGSAEYGEIVRQIESAKLMLKTQNETQVSFGSLLSAELTAKGEISAGTVRRAHILGNKWLLIGGGIGLIVALNIVFIFYMFRWAKRKKEA